MATTVVPSAEMLYIKHKKDRGVKSLIAWYRAEVTLLTAGRQGIFSTHSDEKLEGCQDETEYLAQKWREARLAKLDAASAA